MANIRRQKILKITEENGNETCHMRHEENERNMEYRLRTQPVLDTQWKNVLGKQHGNKFIVHDELKIDNEVRDVIHTNHNMKDAIMEMRSCIVSDISMKYNQMGGNYKN